MFHFLNFPGKCFFFLHNKTHAHTHRITFFFSIGNIYRHYFCWSNRKHFSFSCVCVDKNDYSSNDDDDDDDDTKAINDMEKMHFSKANCCRLFLLYIQIRREILWNKISVEKKTIFFSSYYSSLVDAKLFFLLI